MSSVKQISLGAVISELLQKRSPSSLISGISQNAFNNKLEKHISDIKHGLGGMSRGVANEVADRGGALSTRLATTDPKALRMYSGAVTALRYDRAARFVTNLQYAADSLSALPDKEQAKELTAEIIKAYQQKKSA